MSSSHRSTIEKHITVIKYHLTETCIVFFIFFFYLCRESFHQDGYQKVKEDVVPQGHEGNEVERRPGGGGFHAVVQDSIPVLLC